MIWCKIPFKKVQVIQYNPPHSVTTPHLFTHTTHTQPVFNIPHTPARGSDNKPC